MLEMEEVNAVDLSMVFAPLLFRRKSDPTACVISKSLSVSPFVRTKRVLCVVCVYVYVCVACV